MKSATLFLLIGIGLCFADPAGNPNPDKIGAEIMEEIWRFHPVDATFRGIHRYDHLLPDYSSARIKEITRRFKTLLKDLDNLDTLELDIDQRIDHQLLRINLIQELFWSERIKIYERNPLFYVNECVNGIYLLFIRSAPSTRARLSTVMKRLGQIPQFLDQAKKNLKKPPRILCQISIEQSKEAESLIDEIYALYVDSLENASGKNFQDTKNRAIVALKLFGIWLERNGDPHEPYGLGSDDYTYLLTQIQCLEIDADSLLKIGKNTLSRTKSSIDILRGLVHSPLEKTAIIPPDFGRDDVIRYLNDEIKEVRDFVTGSGLVTVPGSIGELRIVETPGFLRCTIPGYAINPPPPFDDQHIGYIYVPLVPSSFDHTDAEYYYNYIYNHSFRGPAIHEGFPGHHLQLSIAGNHPSLIRKSFYDNFLIEGWALYCEELMATSGLYEDTLIAKINALQGVRFRAARVVVDVLLQTRVYNYEDAVRFMRETIGGDSAFIAAEVKRYIASPAQPSSYLVGELQILELRELYKRAKGENYRLKDFHDELLKKGSIPVSMIRKLFLHDLDLL